MTHQGMDTSYNNDASAYSVVPETDNERLDKSRMIASRSNEIVNNNRKSSTFSVNMTALNDYTSPLISLTRKSALVIENIINNDATNEHTRYGSALTRYISPVIALDEGQDAEDIDLHVTAYRPSGTDFKVYVKVQSVEDSSPFNDRVWTELAMTGGVGVYSSTADRSNFIEYKFGFPTTVGVPTSAFLNNGVVQYTDSAGALYLTYKYFAIKIVLLSDVKHVVPMVSDIRSISLQA